MLTTRTVLVSTIVIAVLCAIAGLVSLASPGPERSLGSNFYGTRWFGYRGLYDLLGAFDVPTSRTELPPSDSLDVTATLGLIGSMPTQARLEPVYLQQAAEWVNAGGRVVLSPMAKAKELQIPGADNAQGPDIFTSLGIAGVRQTPVDLATPKDAGAKFPKHRSVKSQEEVDFADAVSQMLSPTEFRKTTIECRAEGSLASLQPTVGTLSAPSEDFMALDLRAKTPTGKVVAKIGKEESSSERVIAAAFAVGKGEIVVVSDPTLAQNILLADNAPFWHRLLAAKGGAVVFDGFYHGLTRRGNPMELLGRFPIGLFVGTVLALAILGAWRAAVFLGPPLERTAPTRRTVGEYVDAMSRRLERSRGVDRFLLSELRDGVIRSLKSSLHVAGGSHEVEAVAAALARRDPERARRLQQAVDHLDGALASSRRLSRTDVVQTMKRICECL